MRIAAESTFVVHSADELVRRARRLLLMGEAQAAAVAARTAIDTKLRELMSHTPGAVVKKSRGRRGFRATIAERAIALKRAGVLTLCDQRELQRLAGIGGRAAHNDPISLADVVDLLHGAAAFVESSTDPWTERGLPI